MKRIVVLGITTCLFFAHVHGQTIGSAQTATKSKTDVDGKTGLGLKAGVNIASFTDSYKSRIGFHGGVFLNRTINKYFSIQPELLFSGEGRISIYDGVEHTWVLNYVQLPLMLQVYPIKEFYLEAGPQVGVLISAADKIDGDKTQADLKAIVSTAQLAIGVGLGFKATDNVTVYGRYNFGMTDITSYDAAVHHSNVGQVGIAVRFKTL